MTDSFEIRTIEITDPPSDELRDWLQAVLLGFNANAGSDKQLESWLRDLAQSPQRLRGAYSSDFAAALPGPVATFLSFDGELNTGAGLVSANFITDVTVRASHTRRGLMRQLMALDLGEAKGRGQAFAALTATEATIYGRFGFGAATRHTRVELDGSPGFALRVPVEGRLEVADPKHPLVTAAVERLHRGFLETTRGAHSRQTYYRQMLSGEIDFDSGEPNNKIRAVVHLDEAGEINGVLTYQVKREDDVLSIDDLQAASPAVELALWNYVGRHDLLKKVTAHCVDPEGPLRWALADPRRLKITDHKDFTYLRILDVAQALTLRGWERDGAVEITVRDAMDLTPGTWSVTVREGVAEVHALDEPTGASVTLDVSTLASLYFGDVRASTLAGIGLVEGSAEAISQLDALFAVTRRPLNRSHW